MTDYVVFDLNEIREDLGSHYVVSKADEYKANCPVCNESVGQTADRCPVCDTTVVWKNSRAWRRLYGSPKTAIRKLNQIKPESTAAVLLCRRAGVDGFANKTEAQRFRRCLNKLGSERMMEMIDYCSQQTQGRGIINFVINWAQKEIRETDTSRAPKHIKAPKRWM